MAWTTLSFSYGQVLTSAEMQQMQDNFTALASGSTGAPSLTTTKVTTQSVGDNSTAIATTAYCENFVNNDVGQGAIGCFQMCFTSTGTLNPSSTIAGSSLRPLYVSTVPPYIFVSTTALSGTWKNIGENQLSTTIGAMCQRTA